MVREAAGGVPVLDARECRELLGRRGIGRAVYTERALPAVATLNYAVAGDRLWFRTGADTALARAVRDAVIAFHVDHVDAGRRDGWSVTVSGRARLARWPGPGPLEEVLDTWAPGPREQVLALDLALLTGRRLRGGVVVG
ncbi:pyridoxamine 5'-phosphate oxidase family protein [Kineococcus glutinatus]|uniref:Pyridoxamine 5'-phosphate oxidase-like protein n=1 Tax=Kineococcus glutinatus TaxID=1070872 RepID=A0ABP9HY04_9ACTN